MPTLNDFKKNESKKVHTKEKTSAESVKKAPPEGSANQKRRPGRDQMMSDKKTAPGAGAEVKMVEVEAMTDTTHTQTESAGSAEAGKRIEINFPGSELLRAKFPRPFDVAEVVATEWVNDGDFEAIPLENKLAKSAVQEGLRRAKEVEKKVLASPVTEKVATHAVTYAMKAQGIYQNIRSKVKGK